MNFFPILMVTNFMFIQNCHLHS